MAGLDTKPNIIVFFADQQRWDTIGCYGQELPVSPNLDRTAADGARFENAFTCQPVCGPARACLQTGKYATQIGCFRNGIGLPTDERTLANWFSQAGYEVGYIGKWHLATTTVGSQTKVDFVTKPVPPEYRGGYKDYWLASDVLEFTSHGYDGHMFDADMNRVDFKGYRVDCMTAFAIDYLRTRDGAKPFFLFISYVEPHHQNDHNRYEGPNGSQRRFGNFKVPGDLVGTEGDWRESYPDYLGCCASLDYNLGRLRDELVRLDMVDNTLLVYTSDHGSHFRTRNSEYKRSCHDACTRIPLIIHGPGFAGGKVIEPLVSLIDLPPTLLRAGGIELPDSMQGRPLQELLDGTGRDWREEVFMQISESQVGRAMRTAKGKYSVYAPDKDGGKDADSDWYVEEYLYDLQADPHERNNLVCDAAHVDVRRRLAELLKRRMVQAGETEPRIESAV